MNFSFESIKQALVSRLSLLQNWSINILTLGVYSRLLDVIAYGIEKLTFYLEYLYKNSFLKTADDLAAVVTNSWRLGYKPARRIGAFGKVKISGDSTFINPLTTYTNPTTEINRWTVFEDEDKTLSVYATEDAIYYTNTVIGFRNLTALDIPVNLGSGKVGFNVTAHGFPIGQLVTIQGTANYDGDYLIDAATTVNQIVISYPNTFLIETFDGSEKIFTGHIYVPVKQGIPKEFTYIADGTIDEKFTIFSADADNDQVEVFMVDSSGNILDTVTITDDIYLINSLTFYYCSIESLPSFTGFTVQFGDGITSKKLMPGERVLVKYADTLGASGEISETGAITRFQTQVEDLAGNPASIYVTNDTTIASGADYEDIEHIRHFSRNLFFAGYRAHSENDWKAVLDAHPLIQKSVVWTNFDVSNFAIGFTNSIVYVSAVTESGSALTVAEQNDIKINYLKQKRSITDIVQFEPLKKVNAQFRIDAKLNTVPVNPVIQDVYNALVNNFGILNTDYKTNIYESQAIQIISESSSDIQYHHTEIWHNERSEDYPAITETVGSYTAVVSLPSGSEPDPEKQIYFKDKAVELWIRRKISGVLQAPKRIGKTNNVTSTIFEGDNGYTITGGVVNYSFNQLTYNVQDIVADIPFDGGVTFGVQNPSDTDADGYFLRITYQTVNGNGELINDVRLPYFFNITDVSLEDVEEHFTFSY